jgi:hypothetical protein
VYRAAVSAACRHVGVSSARIKFSPPVGIIKFVERLGAADVRARKHHLSSFLPALSHASPPPPLLSCSLTLCHWGRTPWPWTVSPWVLLWWQLRAGCTRTGCPAQSWQLRVR